MTFEELLTDPIFELPLSQPQKKSFDKFIEAFLQKFLSKLNSLDDGRLRFEQHDDVSTEFIKETQQVIVNGLIQTVKAYYDGAPFKAYELLDKTLRNDEKDLYNIIKQKEYAAQENFYRIRNSDTNFPFQAKEMFHIPFELRGKVATQRYSIPGFPSLYLGQTLFVCWEEMNRPPIDMFQAVRLKNVKPIQFIDLTPPDLSGNLWTDEVYEYLMTFPLIACCSVKVKDGGDTFKPEYIVPQLLLQWVRENDTIDGIQYRSTHLNPAMNKNPGKLSNLVLPVKENKPKGHCNKLKAMFEMTEVVSWQLHEYAVGGGNFDFFLEELKYINEKLPKVELIKGRVYPYSDSVLGKLEYFLDGLGTHRIR